jgi:hypothetical protein
LRASIIAGAEVLLFAARFESRNAGKVGRKMVRGIRLHIHLNQAGERAAEVRPLPAAAIDDHAYARNLPAMRQDDVDRLLHAAAAGDDVFGYDKSLVRRDLKTASQDQAARLFFRKNVAFSQRAADFLADNDSAQGRGYHRVALKFAQFVRETAANFRGDIGVLEKQGALEKLPAVQAGAQHEMAVKQRAGLAKKGKQLVAH